MGISIVSIKRSEVEGKTDLEEYVPLMLKLGVDPNSYNEYSEDIINELAEKIPLALEDPEDFNIHAEDKDKLQELAKIIKICQNWNLYFCIY